MYVYMCICVYGSMAITVGKRKAGKSRKSFFPLSLNICMYISQDVCISDVCFSANVSLSAWEKKARALLEANFELPEGKRPPALLSVCSLRGGSRAESAAEKKEQD